MLLTLAFITFCGAVLFFWHNVIYFFQTSVIPWVRKTFGATKADVLAIVLSFADNVATMVRKQIKMGWYWIQQNILSAESAYEQIDASNVRVKDTVIVRQDDAVYEQTTSRTVPWDELPLSIRKQIITNNSSRVRVDDLELLKEQYRSRAENEGISMEDAA